MKINKNETNKKQRLTERKWRELPGHKDGSKKILRPCNILKDSKRQTLEKKNLLRQTHRKRC